MLEVTHMERPSSPLMFCGVHVARSLVFCVVFCRSVFDLLFLCCLSFFDLRILIPSLVSFSFSSLICISDLWQVGRFLLIVIFISSYRYKTDNHNITEK